MLQFVFIRLDLCPDVFNFSLCLRAKKGFSTKSAQIIIPIHINKHSQQVIGNSIDRPIESIIKLYGNLLAESKAIAKGWCLTFTQGNVKNSALKKLVEKTKKVGFYEISEKP